MKAKNNTVPDLFSSEGQTDLANARRFLSFYSSKLRYCHPWKKWLIWDSVRWAVDDDGGVNRLAKSVADMIWHDAALGDKETKRFATRTASHVGIKAMISLAESEVPISIEAMNCNPYLLNCPNGTVDLRTGELRKHQRQDGITKVCPTEYHPEATAPTWEQFQRDVADGDEELISFKQRFYGYALTGDVREQILAIAYGVGSNGKSTEVDAITNTVGDDYTGTMPRSLLMVSRGDRHPTELTTLFGRRLMVGHETDSGGRLSEALVKQLTGGDAISCRGMREDFWTFQPTHKLLLLTNHRPEVKGTDHAIWRRLRLIPYTVKFDGERRDKSMPEKLSKESPGILAWIVRGAVDWYANGLNEPSSVMAATDEYRASQDILGTFLEECCVVDDGCRTKSSHLYDAYKKWCEQSGESSQTQKLFGEAMTEKGFQRKTSNGKWYIGVGLSTEDYGL